MGLSQLKYRTVACGRRRQIRHKLSLLTYGTIVNEPVVVVVCLYTFLVLWRDTHPCLRNTSFFLLFSNSLLQSGLIWHISVTFSSVENIKMSEWNMSLAASTLQASSQCWIGILNISSEHVLEFSLQVTLSLGASLIPANLVSSQFYSSCVNWAKLSIISNETGHELIRFAVFLFWQDMTK
jgi:hypothetical protein